MYVTLFPQFEIAFINQVGFASALERPTQALRQCGGHSDAPESGRRVANIRERPGLSVVRAGAYLCGMFHLWVLAKEAT